MASYYIVNNRNLVFYYLCNITGDTVH